MSRKQRVRWTLIPMIAFGGQTTGGRDQQEDMLSSEWLQWRTTKITSQHFQANNAQDLNYVILDTDCVNIYKSQNNGSLHCLSERYSQKEPSHGKLYRLRFGNGSTLPYRWRVSLAVCSRIHFNASTTHTSTHTTQHCLGRYRLSNISQAHVRSYSSVWGLLVDVALAK